MYQAIQSACRDFLQYTTGPPTHGMGPTSLGSLPHPDRTRTTTCCLLGTFAVTSTANLANTLLGALRALLRAPMGGMGLPCASLWALPRAVCPPLSPSLRGRLCGHICTQFCPTPCLGLRGHLCGHPGMGLPRTPLRALPWVVCLALVQARLRALYAQGSTYSCAYPYPQRALLGTRLCHQKGQPKCMKDFSVHPALVHNLRYNIPCRQYICLAPLYAKKRTRAGPNRRMWCLRGPNEATITRQH